MWCCKDDRFFGKLMMLQAILDALGWCGPRWRLSWFVESFSLGFPLRSSGGSCRRLEYIDWNDQQRSKAWCSSIRMIVMTVKAPKIFVNWDWCLSQKGLGQKCHIKRLKHPGIQFFQLSHWALPTPVPVRPCPKKKSEHGPKRDVSSVCFSFAFVAFGGMLRVCFRAFPSVLWCLWMPSLSLASMFSSC